MSVQERKERERADRERLIVATARELAEQQGWDAVTTRRLAERIEYSQPVLYSHFRGKREIIGAVALEGAAELAASLRAATGAERDPRGRVTALARAYLAFAARNPAVYDAIFQLDGGLAFAREDTPNPFRTPSPPCWSPSGRSPATASTRHCSPRCSGRPCTGWPPWPGPAGCPRATPRPARNSWWTGSPSCDGDGWPAGQLTGCHPVRHTTHRPRPARWPRTPARRAACSPPPRRVPVSHFERAPPAERSGESGAPPSRMRPPA